MAGNPKRILLTGGAGFIGSHVAEALLRNNTRLCIMDNLDEFYSPAWKKANLESIRKIARIARIAGRNGAGASAARSGIKRNASPRRGIGSRAGAVLARPRTWAGESAARTIAAANASAWRAFLT